MLACLTEKDTHVEPPKEDVKDMTFIYFKYCFFVKVCVRVHVRVFLWEREGESGREIEGEVDKEIKKEIDKEISRQNERRSELDTNPQPVRRVLCSCCQRPFPPNQIHSRARVHTREPGLHWPVTGTSGTSSQWPSLKPCDITAYDRGRVTRNIHPFAHTHAWTCVRHNTGKQIQQSVSSNFQTHVIQRQPVFTVNFSLYLLLFLLHTRSSSY